MIRVSRRAAHDDLRRGVGSSRSSWALLDDSLASFERPRGAAFQLSLTLLAALSDSGPYPALGGWHPPFALHAQAALLRQRRAGGRRALTASRRPFQGRSPPRRARPQPRARLRPFRSPLLRAPRLLSLPGLTDMLKFGPSSHMVEGRLVGSEDRRSPSEQLCAAPPYAGFPPHIRKVTIRIGLRLAATNLAPCYVLRRRPSPVVHCRPLSGSIFRIGCSTTWWYKSNAGMIRPQVPLRQPCYDFSFLQTGRLAGLRGALARVSPGSSPVRPSR